MPFFLFVFAPKTVPNNSLNSNPDLKFKKMSSKMASAMNVEFLENRSKQTANIGMVTGLV